MLLTHGDSITELGDNLKMVAVSSSKVTAAIANEKSKIYGVQFHPEVDLTVNGIQMFRNFLYDICGAKPNFTMECRKESCLKYIKENVGNSKVLVKIHIYFSSVLVDFIYLNHFLTFLRDFISK